MTIERIVLREQTNELTAHIIYKKLSERVKDPHNKQVLKHTSDDEMRHYEWLKKKSGRDVKPQWGKIWYFYFISVVFGITFGVKLLEQGEDSGQKIYKELAVGDEQQTFLKMLEDEESHEQELIAMIDEERLKYMGSVVLGLNDALVELTGALAGYTFAFQNTRLIALTGLITGISATLSMAASEYLSSKQDNEENAGKSAIYTGIAYVFTVVGLILPYLLISNPFIALAGTLSVALLIILVFNYYISVAKSTDFKSRFFGMAAISMGVAAISFGIGILVKNVFGIDI